MVEFISDSLDFSSWWPVPSPVILVMFSSASQLLELFDMQATEQNANSKTQYYLEIKQINSALILDVPNDAAVASLSLYCQKILL